MAKQLSPAAVVALKEALCSVYWYKSDLRGFLQLCLSTPGLLNNFNWENYKRQIASDIVDYLVANPATHVGDLTKLCYELCKLTDFSHLKPLDDGPQKVERARNAVNQLRQLVEPHQDIKKEQDEIKRRQDMAAKKLRENAAVRQKLEAIKVRYMALVSSDNTQSRGFELERVMYELFELFDLDPKASFKNLGEQVDGAFSLDGTEYLFEAKWHKGILEAIDMDSYRVEKKAAMKIALADTDAEIEPVPTDAHGYKPEPEMDRLSNILKSFNEQFGTLFADTDRVAQRIRDDIAPKVAADAAYQNAKENTPHTARMAHDQALAKVMQHLLKDDTQVYKQFVENESFKRFVGDMVYAITNP